MDSSTRMITLNIIKILQKYSDENHRLSQKDIIDKLKEEYDMKVDRKTVKRNIKALLNYGNSGDANEIMYEKTTRKLRCKETGKVREVEVLSDFYIHRDFDDSELGFLIESILFNKHIPHNHRKDLINKLEGLSSKYFNSRIKHIRTSEGNTRNHDLILNIELLDEAISNSKQVSFNYNKYGVDKKFQPQLNKDGTIRDYIVNPYQMAATNGKYYLICNYDSYDNISHYRLDRITKLKILDKPRKPTDKVKGLEAGLDLPKHMAEHIYMFTGESHSLTLRFKKIFINEITDWFDINDIIFFDETEVDVSARVTVNLTAMRKWALQYGLHVRVLSPKSLVDEIKRDIKEVNKNYFNESI